MENWQLALVILTAVFIGALIPVFIVLALTIYRAGREIAEVGRQLRPTLAQVQLISDRVELLSRGLDGGEKNIAALLAATGKVADGLERNMRLFNISSAVVASVAPAVAAFLKTMSQPNEPDNRDADRSAASSSEAQPTPSAIREA